MPELRFLPNEAGEGEGLSDAGIETYRADPFPAVARETSQNSRDAHDRVRHPGRPVRVEIDRLSIPTSTLPSCARYREVCELCLNAASASRRKKEADFFRQALRVLNQNEIPVLRIADFRTTGLRGPCEEGSPFHSLVKSSGVSQKDDETSGGSFGIGKSAVYSASDLQTVFYSTLYINDRGHSVFLCQGKTKFMSFVGSDDRPYRSVGYWGEPNGYMPVTSMEHVPDWLKRTAIGTTVCSIGVRDSDDWQHEIMASLLMNFFSAIHRDEMEFLVDGTALDSSTLRFQFENDMNVRAAGSKSEDYLFAKAMYECLTASDGVVEHALEIRDVGTFGLRLIVRDGLPKRVGILRNGMHICDNLAHFGDKLSRFPMYRDFVAVVEPVDDQANAWLRQMENPRHDEFSPERLLTPAERRRAARAGKELASLIREKIKEAAKPSAGDETQLGELAEFFPMEGDGPRPETGPRNIDTFRLLKSAERSRTRRSRPPSGGPGDAGGGPGLQDGGDGGPRRGGPGTGHRSGGKGTRSRRKPFPLRDLRTLMPDRGDLRRRRLLFTPAESGDAVLTFESSGVSEAQRLQTVPHECRVSCVANQRQVLDVVFATAYDGPVEIVSWRMEEAEGEA